MKVEKLIPGKKYKRTRKDVLSSRFGHKEMEVISVLEFQQATIDGAVFLLGGNEVELAREQIESEVSEYGS